MLNEADFVKMTFDEDTYKRFIEWHTIYELRKQEHQVDDIIMKLMHLVIIFFRE